MKRKLAVKTRVWIGETRATPKFNWKVALLISTLILTAVGAVAGGGWLAVRLMLNPASVTWLSRFLPDWSRFATRELQTLAEIQAEVQQTRQTAAAPLNFSTYPGLTSQQAGFYDLLLPVLVPDKACLNSRPCQRITELRVYRPDGSTARGALYRLIDRIAVQGPEELVAIAPLTHSSSVTQGSTRILPLTAAQWMDGASPAGIWLNLSGEWQRGSRVRYGLVLHYDPTQGQLNPLQTWSSVAGQFPRWQQITGSATPELVVDQSVGLEPQLQVFQVQRGRTAAQRIVLESVSLTEAPFAHRTYTNALLLARHGLWSEALALLKTVKQRGNWSAAAQAQLDVIALHAKITQAQADQDWASPTQQVLAQVMDGRWSEALNLMKSAHRSGYDVQNLLSSNADRIWERVEAALRVNARQADLQQWGMLVLAVQQNSTQAMAWFRKQPKPTTAPAIESTLALLNSTTREPALPPASPATPEPTALLPTGLVGSVVPVPQVKPEEWSGPQPVAFTPAPQQQWYRIQTIGLHDGRTWQYPADLKETDEQGSTHRLWQQFQHSNFQLIVWQDTAPIQQVPLTLQALQVNQGRLFLLATGSALPNRENLTLTAVTTDTLNWTQSSSTQTLQILTQQYPNWRKTLIPTLWRQLRAAQLLPEVAADPLQTIGDWAVQTMEVTGAGPPEFVLTIEAEAAAPRTVIFSQQGNILYSDLSRRQSLVALAESAITQQPILILSNDQDLFLQQWSNQTQKFE